MSTIGSMIDQATEHDENKDEHTQMRAQEANVKIKVSQDHETYNLMANIMCELTNICDQMNNSELIIMQEQDSALDDSSGAI